MSLGSTSRVMVLPVRVLTKICIVRVVEGSVTVRGCDMDDDAKEETVRKWRGRRGEKVNEVEWVGRKKEKRL